MANNTTRQVRCFQFLGIPPKGEHRTQTFNGRQVRFLFPISRDPPEGGTPLYKGERIRFTEWGFQFLGIPPKGELR